MENFNLKKINLKNLNYNISYIKTLIGNKKICAMVKADAYGHGLERIVKSLNDVDFFGAANLKEALEVRKINKQAKILIVGKTTQFEICAKNNVSVTISSLDELKFLIKNLHNYAKINIHFKVNCGMNRYGFSSFSQFKDAYKLAVLNNVNVEGVFTHFSCIGEDKEQFEKQKLKFLKFLQYIPKNQIPIIHVGGSGVIFEKNFKTAYNLPSYNILFDMARVGIALYGYPPFKTSHKLKKVMKIESPIVQINTLKKGEFLGYGLGFKAKQDMKIAVLPLGYADGMRRDLTGKIKVKYCKNKKTYFCKVLGKICMDCMFIDISKVPDAKVGDRIIVMDNAEHFAKAAGTISYEILTNFSKMR
ncbi:MAG: alanine racemase [Clostridia bacterium]|nr:alanine racemase [Clostridia bacterium]